MRHFGQYTPDLSAVTVFHFPEDGVTVPVMCLQCEEPACEKVCPTRAVTRGEDGVVVFDERRCIGCKFCVQACPVGMVIHSPRFNKIFKCDLCGGEPLCAAWCPTKAIRYAASPAGADRRMSVAAEFKSAAGPGMAG
jgi:Fe-S-cluster-containing hydrogenase component 2